MRKVRGREVTVSGRAGTWEVEFVDATSGRIIKRRTVKAKKDPLKIALPTFQGSIALKLRATVHK